MVMGRSIRSCKLLKSSALIRITNSETPARVGFTRILTNCIESEETSLMSCESLYNLEREKKNRIYQGQKTIMIYYQIDIA